MTSLEGRVALITGAGNGIGRACAERFARDGAQVAVADIVSAEGQGVASALRDAGHEAVFLQCDVSKSAEVRATVERHPDYFPIYTTGGHWHHSGELWTDWCAGFHARSR